MGELLLDAVLFLCRLAAGAELDANLLNRRETIAKDFPRLDELTIEEYFQRHPVQGDTSRIRLGYVYLPMVADPPLVPILSMSYDLAKSAASLQAGLFIVRGTKPETLRAFGYRYEQPHGAGAHDFWHVQPIHTFRLYKKSRALPKTDSWRPDDAPTFPLDAEAPVDLLVCLMISLYGLRDARRLATDFNKDLDDRFKLMRCCS